MLGRSVARKVAALSLICASAVTTADAAAPATESRTVRIDSKILGDFRTLHISLPPNYRLAKQRYSVVYVLDGHVRPFFEMTVAAAGYDLLGDYHDYAMPPQIVVAIEHKDRGADLGRNAEQFTRFLVQELIPYIDREYRTVPYRTLIGHSLGGRFALQTFCRAPEPFPAIVAISAALPDSSMTEVQGCMKRDFASGRSRIRQVVLSAGSRETRLMTSTQKMHAFLRDSAPTTWRTLLVDGDGLGHTDTPFATIPPALRFVFDRAVWEMPIAAADSMIERWGDPLARLERHRVALASRVGYTPAPSAKWLEFVAKTALARVDADGAVMAAKRLVELYPEEIIGFTLLADAYVQQRDYDGARRAINDALALLDRRETFDEGQREVQRTWLRSSLAGLAK